MNLAFAIDKASADVYEGMAILKIEEWDRSQGLRVHARYNEENGLQDKRAFDLIAYGKTWEVKADRLAGLLGTSSSSIGVQGDNTGWADRLNPKPPVNDDWSHALYCMGFHMHNGVKCIICKSSWCRTGITEHHIKQAFFDSGQCV
jgi:hypothetical protein